jgi:hypothetical protein
LLRADAPGSSEHEFASEWAAGAALSTDEAIAFAQRSGGAAR